MGTVYTTVYDAICYTRCSKNYKVLLTYVQFVVDPEANDGGLEKWGKSLNAVTELNQFKELGTLMYGDPAQGPSIVSR